MTTALVPYGDLEKMAHAMAKSGLFGVKTPEQAIAIMLVAQAEGRHPALAARDYDIIQGRPAKKTEAMLRDYLEQGGKVEWHGLDDIHADATFSHPSGGTVRIAWDMKRAAMAGLGARDMWKKYPRQMLRSRVVSEGIRTVCPMATSGMYVPEELQDFAKQSNTPTAGAAENITPERRAFIQEISSRMKLFISDGAVDDAVLTAENSDIDSEEKIFLWTYFDSKQRSAMKRAAAAMKNAKTVEGERLPDVAAEQPQAAQIASDGMTINDQQRKRLEAMISERKLDREIIKKMIYDDFAKEHFADLSPHEYDLVCQEVESSAPPQQPATPVNPLADAQAEVAGATHSDALPEVYAKLKKAYEFAPVPLKARIDLRLKDHGGKFENLSVRTAELTLNFINKLIDAGAQP